MNFQGVDFLFKIHKYFLIRESTFFRTMFQLPPRDMVEGLSDHFPIHLNPPGAVFVTDEEFADFLRFLYYG